MPSLPTLGPKQHVPPTLLLPLCCAHGLKPARGPSLRTPVAAEEVAAEGCRTVAAPAALEVGAATATRAAPEKAASADSSAAVAAATRTASRPSLLTPGAAPEKAVDG